MENKTLAPIKVPENLKLDAPMKILAQTPENMEEAYELWQEEYGKVYPQYVVNRDDPFNAQSHILVIVDETGAIVTSARLTKDSSLKFPDEKFFPVEINMYRELGMKLMEGGRLINRGSLSFLKLLYKSVYLTAKAEKVEVIIILIKEKDVAFHRNLLGAYLLADGIEAGNGGEYKMACMSWELNQTKERFFSWVGLTNDLNGGAK